MNNYKGTDLYRVAFMADDLVQRAVRIAERTPNISQSARYRALVTRGLQYADPDTLLLAVPNPGYLAALFPEDHYRAKPRFCQVVLRTDLAAQFKAVALANSLSHSDTARYLILLGAADALESDPAL